MAAFDRIRSGMEGFDRVLDSIRLGDNVILQVGKMDDFVRIAHAFVTQAIADQRAIYYIRFSDHKPILEPMEGLVIHELSPSLGFETFTTQIHTIITQAGLDAFYVFDCLSDLQVAWSTDLMMGNFFRVTCPYLFELDTVAYFPILRGHHDFATIARIQETTQLFLDIYAEGDDFFIHPVKVWNRYHPDMFLPYRLEGKESLRALSSSVDLAEYYRLLHKEQMEHAQQNIDSYERFFGEAKQSYYQGTITQWTLNKISRSMMTHDRKMADMIRKEFQPEDFFFIKDRIIGTGAIGGKACGMLLARKMVENHLPEYAGYMEPQDSYYIATDVFYSYIVDNKLWKLRIRQHEKEHYFEVAKELADAIMRGKFSETIRAQFRRMLDYFGHIPIIVRSSSFLEDGYGNAFAGKYKSVFCVNACNPEERLAIFEEAVKEVYASTLDPSALEYRQQRGLDQQEEQMAILVQRVSGSKFGDYYMPCLAGVGFSYSMYRWSDQLRQDAGLLRLVAGLGTKAVDRTAMDYPRLVNLDNPSQTTLVTSEEKHRFSQRRMDTISYYDNCVVDKEASQLLQSLPSWYVSLIAEHDYETENQFRERGQNRDILFISCQGATQNTALMSMMRDILKMLEKQYENPVDIEYTINYREDGLYTMNLLQCRPMSVWKAAMSQTIPTIAKEQILFQIRDTFMGNIAKQDIDVVIYISSREYHALPYKDKASIASVVARINRYYKNDNKTILLLSPGRIGTSSPELGVPVMFADISNVKVICEYADAEIGFVPELSYGSHMFQDIVEAEMFYVAMLGNATEQHRNLTNWKGKSSVLMDCLQESEYPESKVYEEILKVYEYSKGELTLYADHENGLAVCGYFEETT